MEVLRWLLFFAIAMFLIVAGIFFVMGRPAAAAELLSGSPELGLRAHQEADDADDTRHPVGDQPLLARALPPGGVVPAATQPDEPAQVRPRDEAPRPRG